MKAFFASFVGTLLALAAFCFVSFVLVIGSLALLASMGEKTTRPITSGSYLVLNLDGLNLTDAPPLVDEGGLGWFLSGDAPRPLALRRATATLRSAATDPRIRGVLLTGNFSPDGYGTGFAALREFRSALMSVRESGKPIKVYFDQAGTAELYLASVAQEITLNPFGLIIMPGLASEPMFFGEAFEKWGVGVQVTRSGKYKGAIEPFTRRDLSPENREQLTVLLNDLWSTLSTEIATARGTTAAALQTIINAEGLLSPEVAEAAGLISKIAYRDELLATLHTETGAPLGEPFLQVAFSDYAKSTPEPSGEGTVAIVYAEGDIVDGEGNEGEVGGSSFARELRGLRTDEGIAAVVLRVNSPGGSASAAEEILRELRLLAENKPVVVSMGSYAASGGYWISAFADRIYTEATTVTGSIGVFGVQFDVERIASSVGLTWDRVTTADKAGMLTASRPKTPAELAVYQHLVDRVYESFVARVAQGRALEPAAVHAIAQGRVWSGTQAVELGLADELGGLGDAIAHAATLAGLSGQPSLYEYPSTRPLAEALTRLIEDKSHPEAHFTTGLRGPVGQILARVEEQVRMLDRFNDPRGVYARLPLDLRVR